MVITKHSEFAFASLFSLCVMSMLTRPSSVNASPVAGTCSNVQVCSGDIDAQSLAADFLVVTVSSALDATNTSIDYSTTSLDSSGWDATTSGSIAGSVWTGDITGAVTMSDRVWNLTGKGLAKGTPWSFKKPSTIDETMNNGKTFFNLDLMYSTNTGVYQILTPKPLEVTVKDLVTEMVNGTAMVIDPFGNTSNGTVFLKLTYTNDLMGTIVSSVTFPKNVFGCANKGKFSLDPSTDLDIS